MPEIPDLHIFSKNLSKRLLGKRLSHITVLIQRKLKVLESELQEAFEGQVLTAIEREGKELYFSFQNKHVLGIHLMLQWQHILDTYRRTNGLVHFLVDIFRGLNFLFIQACNYRLIFYI